MSEATQRIVVGDAIITAIVEAETLGIPVQLFFPDAAPADVAAAEWLSELDGAADPSGNIAFRVQAFIIEFAGRTVLVDPCVGNGKRRTMPFWNNLATPWLQRFHDAGFSEDDIDLVVHTHLHEDHLGWDTRRVDDEWTPTFTNARYVYVDNELDWAASKDRSGQDPYGDSIEPIIRAGRADVVAADAVLCPGIRLLSTPGHTPGHASMLVESGDGLLISGDFLHHPFQCADPSIAEVGDVNAHQARATRAEMLDHCASQQYVVAGTHFPIAPFGTIESRRSAWRFRKR